MQAARGRKICLPQWTGYGREWVRLVFQRDRTNHYNFIFQGKFILPSKVDLRLLCVEFWLNCICLQRNRCILSFENCVHVYVSVCVCMCVCGCVCACVSVCRVSMLVYSDLLYHGIPHCFEGDSFTEHGTHGVLCWLMASCQAHDASFCLLPNLRVVECQEL